MPPRNGGSEARLTGEQAKKRKAHRDATLSTRTRDIVQYGKETFGLADNLRGLTKGLKQHGFPYHKPAGAPAKANGAAQKAWIVWYETFKKSLKDKEKILFLDGLPPRHAVRFACGSIKSCGRREIPTNGSQRRLNLLGGLDLEDRAIHTPDYETINAAAILAFLRSLLSVLPGLVLPIILDQARSHTAATVKEWAAKNPRIKLHFLPA